jgi:hypothetical protein
MSFGYNEVEMYEGNSYEFIFQDDIKWYLDESYQKKEWILGNEFQDQTHVQRIKWRTNDERWRYFFEVDFYLIDKNEEIQYFSE